MHPQEENMPIIIKPAERASITRLICPECGEKLRGVGLSKESQITGLSFQCHRCDKIWGVETTSTKKNN